METPLRMDLRVSMEQVLELRMGFTNSEHTWLNRNVKQSDSVFQT